MQTYAVEIRVEVRARDFEQASARALGLLRKRPREALKPECKYCGAYRGSFLRVRVEGKVPNPLTVPRPRKKRRRRRKS